MGSSLLARILVGKYVEHTPLYRQSEIYARHGLALSRNTMVRWVAMMGNRLRPLTRLSTSTSCRLARCTLMIRRSGCWSPGVVKREPDGCGSTSGMTGTPERQNHRRSGSRTQLLPTVQNWVFRNLGGTFQARGLITRRLSNSNPARPYICRFSIFRRFTCPSTTPLLHRLVIASYIAAASASIPAATR